MEHSADIETIRAIKKTHEAWLMSKANVIGVGIGLRQVNGVRTNTPALVVLVNRKLPVQLLGPDDIIPGQIQGVPVDVQEIGLIKAQTYG